MVKGCQVELARDKRVNPVMPASGLVATLCRNIGNYVILNLENLSTYIMSAICSESLRGLQSFTCYFRVRYGSNGCASTGTGTL